MTRDPMTGRPAGLMALPDLTGTLAGTELAGLIAEHDKLKAQNRALRKERDEAAGAGKRQAQQRDAEAWAAATRAGKADPGAKNADAAAAKLADLERQLAGSVVALAACERDIRDRLNTHRPAYLADVTRMTEESRAQLHAAVAGLLASVNEHHRRLGLALWMQDGRKAVAAPWPDVPGLPRGQNVGDFGLAAVLTALEARLRDW